MEIIPLEKTKDGLKLSFLIRGTTPAFVNTLRRVIIEEVPTMAIEDVEIRKNNSILYDEMIAHRLGLVPLKTDLKSYIPREECKCNGEGCARCQVTITLKAGSAGYVYASDLKSGDDSVVPVYPKMIIAKLNKGQILEVEAKAVLGKGKTHSKWTPANVYYYNESKISVNNEDKLLKEFASRYPPQIFDKSGKVDRNLINTPTLIDACEGVSKLVEIERKEDSFIFVIESWGQLSPKAIIQEAIKQVDTQLDSMIEIIKQ